MDKNPDIISTIERVVAIFKYERIAYIVITLISFIALISLLTYLLIADFNKNIFFALGMFGPTGLITFSCGKILKMWSDVMQLLNKHISND